MTVVRSCAALLAGLLFFFVLALAPDASALEEGEEGFEKGVPEATVAPPTWVPSALGDENLAAKALEDSGAATKPPRIGLGTYLGDVYTRFQQGIAAWWESVLTNSQGLGKAIVFGAKVLVAMAVLAVAIWLFTTLLGLWRRRGRQGRTTDEEDFDELPATALAPQIDASAWRHRFAELLAADKIEDALEALWWWLARSLAGAQADSSWTSRELVERFQRKDLLRLVRQLDILQYGPRRPSRSQVEELAQDLERAVA